MIRLCVQVVEAAISLSIPLVWEHPEDLGSVHRWGSSIRPASVGQLGEIQQWLRNGSVSSGALYQCHFGAASPKPTRLLFHLVGLRRDLAMGPQNYPKVVIMSGLCRPDVIVVTLMFALSVRRERTKHGERPS